MVCKYVFIYEGTLCREGLPNKVGERGGGGF